MSEGIHHSKQIPEISFDVITTVEGLINVNSLSVSKYQTDVTVVLSPNIVFFFFCGKAHIIFTSLPAPNVEKHRFQTTGLTSATGPV